MTAMTTRTATTAADPPPASSPAPVPAFRGFQAPNYTPVPDQLFDELLPTLSGAELKVLLFIIRRTFGFKRDADSISLSQMLHGIQTREGRTLHQGVGLSKPTLLAALRSLQAKGIVHAERQRSAERGDEPTVYALRFAARDEPRGHTTSPPVVKKVDQGGGQAALPGGWARNLTTQQTGPQQTEHNKHQHPLPPSSAPAPELKGDTLAPSSSDDHGATGAVDDDALLAALVSRGITRRIAQELVTTCDAASIRQQIEWHPYRRAVRNPAGALVEAIKHKWPAPPAWLDAQRQAAEVACLAEEEAQRQAEDDARRREWEAKPPEERIQGRLQFWLQGRRVKGHEPTEAELAARRVELLTELVETAREAAPSMRTVTRT